MARDRFEGLTVESAINVIKQKHFSDLDAEDFAFLKAREDYLTEADKAMYLKGENPVAVQEERGEALTRNERIINENRPLQENERRIREARNEGFRLEREANRPLVGKAKDEADKALAEAREEKIASLEEEVKRSEKEEKEVSKERAASAEKEAKEVEKAQPVKVVADKTKGA